MRIIKWIFGCLLGMGLYMSQISLNDATSNFSSYFFWLPNLPSWAEAPATDTTIFIMSAIGLVMILTPTVVAAIIERLFEKPFSGVWHHTDPLYVWHLACLFAGKEPRLPIVHGSEQYPYLKMLNGDVANGILKVKERNKKTAWSTVSHDAARDYIKAKGISVKWAPKEVPAPIAMIKAGSVSGKIHDNFYQGPGGLIDVTGHADVDAANNIVRNTKNEKP